MATYGYVSKKEDKSWLKIQLKAITSYNVDDLFFEEEREDNQYRKLISKLEEGDSLVLYQLEALEIGRSDWQSLFLLLKKLEVRLILIGSQIDTNDPNYGNFIGSCLLFMQAEATVRREIIQRSLVHARQKGTVLGRPKIAKDTIEKIHYYRDANKMSIREIANLCGVSIGTVHKYINITT